jgi:hypothetical protein
LSRLRGNSHERFLGELGDGDIPGLPDLEGLGAAMRPCLLGNFALGTDENCPLKTSHLGLLSVATVNPKLPDDEVIAEVPDFMQTFRFMCRNRDVSMAIHRIEVWQNSTGANFERSISE